MNELGIDNFDIEVIEEYPCETKEELHKREGELIREFGTLNTRIEGRTKEEYYKEFEEYFKQYKKTYKKQWKIDNREHYLKKDREYRKTYREKYKEQIKEKQSKQVEWECGGKYTLSHKAEHMNSKKHLKYLGTYNEEEYKQSKRCQQIKNQYEKTKDNLDEEKMKEYKQKWYENNKDDMSRKSKERVMCECGVEVCQGSYTRHLKSKTHINFLNNNIGNVQVSQEEQENRDEGTSS